MPRIKGPRLQVPRKIKGGAILGKENDTWFAVKAVGFSKADTRDFKQYFAACCKEFFTEDEPEDEKVE